MTTPDAPAAAERAAAALAALVAETVATLVRNGAPDEALATVTEPKKRGPFTTQLSMAPAGTAWRLGALLVTRDGRLLETGEVTRAIEPKIAVTNRSAEAERAREFRRAAARGKFPGGRVINHGYRPLALDADSLARGSGPLSLDGDTVMLRWDASGNRTRLDSYLTERTSLFGLD